MSANATDVNMENTMDTNTPEELEGKVYPPVGTAKRFSRSTLMRFLPLGIVVAILVAGYFSGLGSYLSLESLQQNKEAINAFVGNNFVLAVAIYMLVYIAAVAVSFPGASILTIAGGAIFGWVVGGFATVVAATIGASIIFMVAKTSLGDMLAAKAGPRMQKLREGFQADAFNYLLTLRLAPVVPFWITNLAPAFFGMDLVRYAVATFLGIIPGTFAYTFIGQQVGLAVESGGSDLTTKVALGLGALAVASVIPLIVKRVRSKKAA